jgi:hypothetical protein
MKRENQLRSYLNLKLSLIALLMLVVFSCEKEESIAVPSADIEKHLQFLENNGFHKDHIVYDATKDEFIIEDDMTLSREEIENYMAAGSATDADGRTEQRRGSFIISSSRVTNIKYYMDGTVPASWRTAVTEAVNQWNAVNGTSLFMSIVSTSAGSDVRVNAITENGAGWVARATLPSSSGAPGSILTINMAYNSMDAGRKLFAMAHEMGHNIGLLHTNQTSGTIIPGTPTTDANSVMNSFVLPWNGFTHYDQVSVQVLYPGDGGGSNGITAYKHCDYGGYALTFGVGSYNRAAILAAGGLDNDVSSVRVPSGYRVTFYDGDNFTGATLVKTADDNCLVNDAFNDRTTSLRVEQN